MLIGFISGQSAAVCLDRLRNGWCDLTELAALSNDDADYRAIADMFVRRYAAASPPGLMNNIAGWRPDVIVRESLDFAAEVAAERLDDPSYRRGAQLDGRRDPVIGTV